MIIRPVQTGLITFVCFFMYFGTPIVAANHEYDTCFANGLVMGSADCINCAGLIKH